MLNKTLITITGTTTAGKSTLAETLLKSEKIAAIPHSTCRKPREDDNPLLIQSYSKDDYRYLSFVSCHGDYGTQLKDILDFRNGNKEIGVGISSSLDLITLSSLYQQGHLLDDSRRCHILVRLTNSLSSELDILNERLKDHFHGAELNKRMKVHGDIIKEFFFCSNYENSHVDLILSQEDGHVDTWISVIESYINQTLFPDVDILRENIKHVSNRITSQRVLKRA